MQSDRIESRGALDDLSIFVTVARQRSFSRAAAVLGMSNSMLSYTIKRLEKRLGFALLHRTSRSVAPSEAGYRLLQALEPAFSSIDGVLAEIGKDRDRLSGAIRLTATRQGFDLVLRPMLADFCARYPLATVEVVIDYSFRDVVSEGFDAGIRLGEKLQQDMTAMRASGDLRMAVVASPGYLRERTRPKSPEDLYQHRCINYRMMSAGHIYAWEFEKKGREINIRVPGPLVFNEPDLMLESAVSGIGVAYVLENEAMPYLEDGRLVRLLSEWTPRFPGFFIYYPSRRQVSPVLSALIDAIRTWRDR